jgi:glycosyltransferase involved in cell wall biosynthesis
MTEHLRVAIDARILPGTAGGVATATATLVRDLGRLGDGPEEYVVVVASEDQRRWIQPLMGPNQRIVLYQSNGHREYGPQGARSLAGVIKRALGPLLPVARRLQHLIAPAPSPWLDVPLSDGFWEGLGCDVLHIMIHQFTLCSIPTIYNPHDLLHLHYPQFFSPEMLAWREGTFPAGCRLARVVAVGSKFIKDDVVRQYGISPEKVQVVPEGAPTEAQEEPTPAALDLARRTYGLEPPFVLYPAVTWPHKNHLRLLEALALVRDRHGERVRLVCTGGKHPDFWPRIERRIRELQLEGQVRFVGFVPQAHMRAVYRLAEALVQPSLFEASSLPIFEAWLEGTPVACGDAAALPDQVQDAGLLFDPHSVESIATAVLRLRRDEALRAKLRDRGYERLRDFGCERTARAYRALYRRVAGLTLDHNDRELLEWDWMREPRRKLEVMP